MNFFFGLKTDEFVSHLTIPRFKNKYKPVSEYSLFKGEINNDNWNFVELENCNSDTNFFYLNEKEVDNNSIYFLAKNSDIENQFIRKKIINFNSYTETDPPYRANFNLIHKSGGESSYQSEYPFPMIERRGSVLSSIYSLTNADAEKNYLIFRNIFMDPIYKNFYVYLINIKSRKVIKKYQATTNFTNIFQIHKNDIHPEIYFFSDTYLGIPIYLSQLNSHLSLEHTHPPHEYILDQNKHEQIKKLKNSINEIIN